jgi:two-component system sensor histidine kinase CreC
MRSELEGKNYVERYVQTLTHELKSPLSAIRGAAELLRGAMPSAQRERFLTNIETETARLESLSERLLLLAQVEKRTGLEEQRPILLQPLAEEVIARSSSRSLAHRLELDFDINAELKVEGERFLLAQALSNLLDNAIEFTPDGGSIRVSTQLSDKAVTLSVKNQGSTIPDYALCRLKERFYSLPRPRTGRKSTGLGLSFVQEVAELHGGTFTIENSSDGVVVRLQLPRFSPQV